VIFSVSVKDHTVVWPSSHAELMPNGLASQELVPTVKLEYCSSWDLTSLGALIGGG
jgi:hypothetical protein